MNKSIAIIGGTFNPVHNGHIEMGKYIIDNELANEVLYMPSYYSPHKNIDTINTFNDRVQMLNIAISNCKFLSVSTFEKEYYINLKNKDKTYTIDVLDAFDKNIDIHFVIGFDSIRTIDTWHEYIKLLSKYSFIIFDRCDDIYKTLNERKIFVDNLHKNLVSNGYGMKYIYIDYQVQQISSTKLRELLNNNNRTEVLKYIDKNVYNYIIENNLY